MKTKKTTTPIESTLDLRGMLATMRAEPIYIPIDDTLTLTVTKVPMLAGTLINDAFFAQESLALTDDMTPEQVQEIVASVTARMAKIDDAGVLILGDKQYADLQAHIEATALLPTLWAIVNFWMDRTNAKITSLNTDASADPNAPVVSDSTAAISSATSPS